MLKVKLTEDIPDPALVVCKAAVNWSDRCGEKLLPACPDGEIATALRGCTRGTRSCVLGWLRPPADPELLAARLSRSSTRIVTSEKEGHNGRE